MATDTSAARATRAPSPGKPARSKATRWRAAVLIAVHVLAAIHIAHWMTTGSTVSPLEPSESMEFAKNSVVNAGLVFFAITILSTLILGRWFCGWACHVVALQDLSRALLLKVGIRPRPMRSRWMMLVPLAAGFYMFLWPVVYRLWIKDSFAVQGAQWTTEGFWDTFTTSWFMAGLTFFIAGFVAVYFLGAKGFCTYACPYGAVFGTVDRLSPGRIRVTDACVQCGHCSLTCTSNVDVSREVHDYGMVVDPGCMKCMDCVSVCPEDALYFGFGKPALFAKPIREKRPAPKPIPLIEEAVGLGATAFAYVAWRGWRQDGDFLLSLGVAITFGFLAVTTLRLVRKKDVKWPGWTLKKGGSATAPAQLLGVGVVVLAGLAVPFGVSLEVHARRALKAERVLDEARLNWFQPGGYALDEDEREAAETLLASAEVIDARTGRETVHNTMRLVWSSLFLGEMDTFEAALERALEMPKAGPDPRVVEATLVASRGDLPRAVEILESVERDFPRRPDSYRDLAQAQVAMGRESEARDTLLRGAEACPDDAFLAVQEALIELGDTGDEDVAVRAFDRALEMEPDDLDARNLVWATLRNMGRPERALEVLAEGVARDDAPPHWRSSLAQALVGEGRFGEAIESLEDGLSRKDAPLEWRADLAQVLFSAGRPDAAAREARRLVEAANGERRFLVVAAYVLEQTGHEDEAEEIRSVMPPAPRPMLGGG